MDNLLQLAMQIIFCLLIAALLGAIIGYLLGKMSKCDKDDYDLDPNTKRKVLNDYETDRNTTYTKSSIEDENYIKENITSGISKTETMAAAGIAGAGALGAGIVNKVKDTGSDIKESVLDTRDEFTRDEHIKKDFTRNEHTRDELTQDEVTRDNLTTEEFTKDFKENHTGTTSVGQEIGIRPTSVEAPSNGELDDLKEISGIGLKIEEILNSLGIYYFEQISEWSPENIEWIENYLSLKRRVKKEDWIGQAKLLAAGGHTEFSQKVKRGENRNYS